MPPVPYTASDRLLNRPWIRRTWRGYSRGVGTRPEQFQWVNACGSDRATPQAAKAGLTPDRHLFIVPPAMKTVIASILCAGACVAATGLPFLRADPPPANVGKVVVLEGDRT